MNELWEKFKWLGTNILWLIAGLVLLIDPSHIDKIVAAHPKWAGAILFLWTALLSWAQKTKPQQGPNPHQNPQGTAKQ